MQLSQKRMSQELCMLPVRHTFLALMTQYTTYRNLILISLPLMEIVISVKSLRTVGATFVAKMFAKLVAQNFSHSAKIMAKTKMTKIVV